MPKVQALNMHQISLCELLFGKTYGHMKESISNRHVSLTKNKAILQYFSSIYIFIISKGNKGSPFNFSLYSFIDFKGKLINEMKGRDMVMHIENFP